MSDACIVLTTFENEESARLVLDTVLSEGLAACIQQINIKSTYMWDETIQHDNEILVLIKTTESVYEPLKKRLEELHPYDIPEILKVPVLDGAAPYLKWLKENTKT